MEKGGRERKLRNNEIWKLGTGYIAAYTENKKLIGRIRRAQTRQEWLIMAEYHSPAGKRFAVQYEIPAADRRQAERAFKVDMQGNLSHFKAL